MPKVSPQKPNQKTTPPQTQTSKYADNGTGIIDAWSITDEDKFKVLLYGRSASGKTTLWATFPKPILAIICSGGVKSGELRSINTPEYRKTIHPKIATTIDSVNKLIDQAQPSNYATVVLDHATGLQDLALKEVLGLDEIPVQKNWGIATREQHGQGVEQCKHIFRRLININCHVVITAQEREFGPNDERALQETFVGASLSPSLAGWLNPSMDYILQTVIRPKMKEVIVEVGDEKITEFERVNGVEYCVRCQPHDVYITKFRKPKGGKPLPDFVVDPTYEKLVGIIKG